MTFRERYESIQLGFLSPYATKANESKGRARSEAEHDMRTCFQRDTDRIIHSKAFRRLKHKTQVFLSPEGDHYRTRLTHVIEVSRIARTMARALLLNEDLIEAMSLGHDLGHTPFGHAGEDALNEVLPGGFKHNLQGVRVVERLEKNGKGLNLCFEVIDGIACHTGKQAASTPEGRLLKFADRIAYINHDIDDAERAGILKPGDIPQRLSDILGGNYSSRIDTMAADVIANSSGENICMSEAVGGAMMELREFMFERVYKNPAAKNQETKAKNMLIQLYEYYIKNPDALPGEYLRFREEEGIGRAACDYIACMTDIYAVNRFHDVFIPFSWNLSG